MLTVLVEFALVVFIARTVLGMVIAWRDHWDERRTGDLMPHLIRAYAQLRAQNRRLKELEAAAARIEQRLWEPKS